MQEKRLLESFLVYLSRNERELVGVSLMNGEQEEKWLELLDQFTPKARKIREVILGIAHKELLHACRPTSSTAGAHLWLLIGRELSSSEVLLEVFMGHTHQQKIDSFFLEIQEHQPEDKARSVPQCLRHPAVWRRILKDDQNHQPQVKSLPELVPTQVSPYILVPNNLKL